MSMEALNRGVVTPAVLLVLMLLTDVWPGALAAQGASDRLDLLFDFAIPAQELNRALDHYSQASGMAILLDREVAKGRRSAQVNGRFQARQALEQLLAGSGLVALYAGGDAFTVKPAPPDNTAQKRERAKAQGGAGNNFASALQHALREALCASAITRPGHYRAALQLWIGPLGAVENGRLLASTGDAQRDRAVLDRVRGMRISQVPPSSLPQPVTVLVVPDTETSRTECNPRKEQ